MCRFESFANFTSELKVQNAQDQAIMDKLKQFSETNFEFTQNEKLYIELMDQRSRYYYINKKMRYFKNQMESLNSFDKVNFYIQEFGKVMN